MIKSEVHLCFRLYDGEWKVPHYYDVTRYSYLAEYFACKNFLSYCAEVVGLINFPGII